MIRNAVLHLNGEQPLLCDLFDMPAAGDIGLRCTNLRLMNGKRPVFADDSKSIFFFPYVHIRFVEVLPHTTGSVDVPVEVPDGDQQSDPVPAAVAAPDDELDAELEIDEDFLRRIREV